MNNNIKRDRVADLLRSARVQKGLSQTELGVLVGSTQNTIARIENSRFSPNADQLYKLCEVLDLPILINGVEI